MSNLLLFFFFQSYLLTQESLCWIRKTTKKSSN